MIPGTLLGALFLAACLVPGFVFQRVAERRRAQPTRSALLEAVELAAIGAGTALVAVPVVLLLARGIGVLDLNTLADDPGRYLLLHPARGLGSMLAVFALGCGLARGAAQIAFRGDSSVFEPASTVWVRVLLQDRPDDRPTVLATVELKDGRRIVGVVRTFSAELEDSRELALGSPLAAQSAPGKPLVEIADEFVILREEQIATITGRYVVA